MDVWLGPKISITSCTGNFPTFDEASDENFVIMTTFSFYNNANRKYEPAWQSDPVNTTTDGHMTQKHVHNDVKTLLWRDNDAIVVSFLH